MNERLITETPQAWVILKLPDNQFKVFGTWSGGYLDSDRYRLNSGIEKVEQDEEYYYFVGFSGSCYKCFKKSYGVVSSYGHSVLNSILNHDKGVVELMEDREDWMDLLKENK